MTVEFRGRQYELIRASDVESDGMWLELYALSGGGRSQMLDAFYSDACGEMNLTAYAPDMPLELVEWFVSRARQLLPPVPGTENESVAEQSGSRPPA
jgi:hypothetical protein